MNQSRCFSGMRSRTEWELLDPAVERIGELRRQLPASRAVLVGLSGIDASGKGYLAARLESRLQHVGWSVALLGVDGWLNLPHLRFTMIQLSRHFYEHGLRLAEMFEQLVLPLRDRRSLHLEMDYTEETARQYRRHCYEFHDVEVVLVEGIFLFKREFRKHFDMVCWIDCSFDTAIDRALQRGQEGLPVEQTVHAFETTYLPAQRIHFERDQPQVGADLIIVNDASMIATTGDT